MSSFEAVRVPLPDATLRAIIVDDEPVARDELAFLLRQCEGMEIVGAVRSAAEALTLCDDERPEVAFVDLRMPGLDGVAFAQRLRNEHPDIDVVIVSGHREGAIRAFEAQVSDYLLKPVRLERLRRSLSSIASARRRTAFGPRSALERIAAKRKGAYLVVEVAEIVYFQAKNQLIWAVTGTDRLAVEWTLATLGKQLDPEVFFQSHRSCIVRVDRIRKIEPTGARRFDLLLDHPEHPRVPLARDRVDELRSRIPFVR